ncbi:MAG: hypothetical protein ACM3PY_21675 [Omnitrophica WOR_2 bacterium]
MKRNHLYLFLSLALLFSIACNLTFVLQNPTNAPVINESPKPTAVESSATPVKKSPTIEPTQSPLRSSEATFTPQPSPTPASASCLVGSWEIQDLSPYVLAALASVTDPSTSATYKSTSGHAIYSFYPDGTFRISAKNFELLFDVKASIFTVPLTIRVDGEANGKYQADENVLTTDSMDTSQLNASAQAAGQDLAQPSQIIASIPLITPPYNIAAYTCQDDHLSLIINGYPSNIPPLVFNRVKDQ